MKTVMNLKAKALLATAVVSIGLFVNASPIWAEPQPLTIPSDGIVLQGQAKEKYVADYMKNKRKVCCGLYEKFFQPDETACTV